MSTITDPIAVARRAAEDFKNCYGADLLSVIVYGSAAGGHFDPKRSDINLLLVLAEMALPMIEKSEKFQAKWMKKRCSRPFFMDKEYINASLDSFPVEFLAMKGSYSVIFGEDVLKDIRIDDRDLQIQVERELRGKWLHLLREWPGAKRNPRLLRSLLHSSMRDFSAIFQALLHLKNQPVLPERKSLFAEVTKNYGLEERALLRTMEAVRSGNKKEMVAVFPAYVRVIKTLIVTIDQFHIKERA
jgi:predicted nucleotidyltransferase